MKHRVRRVDLLSVIHFYNEQLALSFGERALSEAKREMIRRGFDEMQKEKQKNERTNVWFTPFCVEFNAQGGYTVALANEKQVLIID